MQEESLNPTGEEKEGGKNAKATFCEKLLSCCACGKIYFSRQPIALLTLSRKDYYICASCSATIACTRCHEPIQPENTLVVEKSHKLEFLCSSCRETVLIGSGLFIKGIHRHFVKAISRFFERIARSEIWPGRRRSKR